MGRSSPIAADGGFGPMDADDLEDATTESEHTADQNDDNPPAEVEEGFGDDFDDFEAGAENGDFGDFDEAMPHSSSTDAKASKSRQEATTIQSFPPADIPFVSRTYAKPLITDHHSTFCCA